MKKYFEHKKYIFLNFIFIFILAYLLTEILLYSQNLLIRHEDWQTPKFIRDMTSMGAFEFLTSRDAVAENRVNLDTWYGYHELIFKRQVNPESITFNVQIKNDTAIDFIYNKDDFKFEGVHLSTSSNGKSFYFESSNYGYYTKIKLINLPDFVEVKKNVVLKNTTQNRIEVSIDGKFTTSVEGSKINEGLIGLRSYWDSGNFSSLQIKNKNGSTISSDFVFRKNSLEIFGINFIMITLLVIFIFFAYVLKNKFQSKDFLFAMQNIAILLVTLNLISVIWYFSDFSYLSRYSKTILSKDYRDNKSFDMGSFEIIRGKIFNGWYSLLGNFPLSTDDYFRAGFSQKSILRGPIICSLENNGCSQITNEQLRRKTEKRTNDEVRIAFSGTSQTVGAGAKNLENTFFGLIYKKLSDKYINKQFMMVNFSISGSNLPELYKEFVTEYAKFKPNLLVLNISNNDQLEYFSEQINAFITFAKKNNIKILLIGEANNSDKQNKIGLIQKHKILIKAASETNTAFYSLNEYLNKLDLLDSGWIWWDNVHLSDYGHQLVADWLTVKIEKELGLSAHSKPTKRN